MDIIKNNTNNIYYECNNNNIKFTNIPVCFNNTVSTGNTLNVQIFFPLHIIDNCNTININVEENLDINFIVTDFITGSTLGNGILTVKSQENNILLLNSSIQITDNSTSSKILSLFTGIIGSYNNNINNCCINICSNVSIIAV
jgi:hypothetical protein